MPNTDNCLVDKTQTSFRGASAVQAPPVASATPDASVGAGTSFAPDNYTISSKVMDSPYTQSSQSFTDPKDPIYEPVYGASSDKSGRTVDRRPSNYIREKERRLREQNLEMQRPLKKVPKVGFGSNRFGPLMFLLAFGVAGMYYSVMSFAAPDAPAERSVSLIIEPSERQIKAGETVTVRVWSDSLSQPVDAVRAQLAYDTESFEFVSIDDSLSSFATDESSVPNAQGVLLSRKSASALIGRQLVASVVLRAKDTSGNLSLWFDKSSSLMHASENRNVLESTSGGTYFVSAATN